MQGNVSLASSLAWLPEQSRAEILASLTDEEALGLLYDWLFWSRPSQRAPQWNWQIWLILAGRGFGKTRSGAEWVRGNVKKYGRWHFVGETAGDLRDVMVEGESGILAISPRWERPIYEPSKRRLTWPNGAIATLFSATEPDQLRGPQCEAFWADEIAKWKYPDDTWDNLMFGFRLGDDPKGVATTTPRPIKIVKDLLADPMVAKTRGSTYENIGNLAQPFIDKIIKKYEGTRLGRQELNAEILDDNPNALWQRMQIEKLRLLKAPELSRIIIAIDPSGSSTGNEAGIIAAGIGECGCKGKAETHGFVIDDRSLQGSPNEWASAGVAAYYAHHADRVIGEQNNGGDMVENTVKTVDSKVSYKKVWASRGKYTRAEPVAALYEQGKVHHVGTYPQLEDELCQWEPSDPNSPNRLDALVWGLTELMLGQKAEAAKPQSRSVYNY